MHEMFVLSAILAYPHLPRLNTNQPIIDNFKTPRPFRISSYKVNLEFCTDFKAPKTILFGKNRYLKSIIGILSSFDVS